MAIEFKTIRFPLIFGTFLLTFYTAFEYRHLFMQDLKEKKQEMVKSTDMEGKKLIQQRIMEGKSSKSL